MGWRGCVGCVGTWVHGCVGQNKTCVGQNEICVGQNQNCVGQMKNCVGQNKKFVGIIFKDFFFGFSPSPHLLSYLSVLSEFIACFYVFMFLLFLSCFCAFEKLFNYKELLQSPYCSIFIIHKKKLLYLS